MQLVRVFSGALVIAGLQCVTEIKAVTLAWNASAEADLAGYKLFWGETNTPAMVRDLGKVTQTQVTNLVAGRRYYFYLTSYNAAALESSPSATIYYTQPQAVPAAPSNLTGVVDSSTQVRLQWRDNSTNETGFRLMRKAGVSGSYTTIPLGANVISYTDTGVTAGTQYFYKIQAYNSTGNSADSTEISLTTPASPPPISVNTTASFVRDDAGTSGDWRGTYGTRGGFAYPYGSFSLPAFVQISAWQNFPLTWAASTTDPRALQKSTGMDRFAASWHATNFIFFYLTFKDTEVHPVSFYFLDFDRQGRQQKLEFFNDDSGELLGSSTISNFENGVYSTWDLQGNVRVKVTRLAGPSCVLSAMFFGEIPPASASFLGSDTTTSGSWIGHYGGDGGFAYPYGILVPPDFVRISAWQNYGLLWSSSTTSSRALQRPSETNRFAGAWNSTNFLYFFIRFTDTNTHHVSLYFLDYERLGRQQKLEVFDDATGNLLASTTVSNFQNGVYQRWSLRGEVRIKLTRLSGPNCVLSGMFFDPAESQPVSFIAADTTTSGTCRGIYGSEGFSIAGETPALPAGTSVTVTGANTWIWNPNSTSTAALERPMQTGRIASAWYAPTQYTATLAFNDFSSREVSFYFVDFDNLGRAQLVELLDPATGTVIDSTELSDFRLGIWLRYRVQGGVKVRITSLGSGNAVMSGVFLD